MHRGRIPGVRFGEVRRVSGRPFEGGLPRFTREAGLRALGLDVTYERADGSRMWHTGSDRPVWDFLGGYGSTFLGHNHPALRQAAIAFLEAGGVVHGQASVRSVSDRLERALSDRLTRALGTPFEIVLSNTGSEAIEIAAKHAALALAKVHADVLGHPDRRSVARGARWTDGARAILREHAIDPAGDVSRSIVAHNRHQLAGPTIHIAVTRSYHGMTARALALTSDPESRFGPCDRERHVRFVDSRDAGDLARTLAECDVTLLRHCSRGERIDIEHVTVSRAAAFYLEPIQGEGGIYPIEPEVAMAWEAACRKHRVPLIVDEIQSGMGRTGTFLHCEQLGIRPSYVLLGKSLGGGLAKVSAVAIDRDRFLPGFTVQHGSTFAGDDWSSSIALAALDLLDADNALAHAAEKGATLLRALRGVAQRHPRVITDVRGRGLMLGIEWREQEFLHSNMLAQLQAHGWLGYALAGYLLRAHSVRVGPTVGRGNTIRIEPAYSVPREAVDALIAALDELCVVLERQDAAGILAPGLGLKTVRGAARRSVRRVLDPPAGRPHVGFIGHFIGPADIELWDGSLSRLRTEDRRTLLQRIQPIVEPVVAHRESIASINGQTTMLSFVGLAVSSERFHHALRTPDRRTLRDLVQRAVDLAVAQGCTVVGLGGYCSIITRNGKDVHADGIALTTGNGYAAGASIEAVRREARDAGIDWATARVAIVGATGNIGSVLAELIAPEVGAVTLVARDDRRAELERMAGQISLAAGPGSSVTSGSDIGLCRDANVIISATNDAGCVIRPCHVSGEPTVILDLAVPKDVHACVAAERPNAHIICGGVIQTPGNPGFTIPGVPLNPGEMYACMAETVLMGIEGHTADGSIGALTPDRVRATIAMAERHGFASVRATTASHY